MSEKKSGFNVNDVGVANGRYFGMPFETGECPVVLISVPWDATVSYRGGTSNGPDAIIDASVQVDLYDEFVKDSQNLKIGTDDTAIEIDGEPDKKGKPKRERSEAASYIKILNLAARLKARQIIDTLSEGKSLSKRLKDSQKEINGMCEGVNYLVESICREYHRRGQLPGVVGGEHSVAFGSIKAAAEALGKGESMGVLQFDAHADLRKAYEGFEYSHASVMYNVLSKIPQVKHLTQVGIRDFCSDEAEFIRQHKKQISTFTDAAMAERLFEGESWNAICEEIVASLPAKVYISFDIDGLEPSLCPNTGTPVPGGLTFNQAVYLLRKVAAKREIVAFDLNEVAPKAIAYEQVADEWDANVGARLLHKLCIISTVNKYFKD